MTEPGGDLHLTVPQARALADACRAGLAGLRRADLVWSEGTYEHLSLMFGALARLMTEALIMAAEARGLDHDAALDDARKVLENHLVDVEMAMLDAGVMLTPGDDIPVTTDAPDD